MMGCFKNIFCMDDLPPMTKRPHSEPSEPAAASKRQKTTKDAFVRFQIIAGSYERLLYGLNAEYDAKTEQLLLTPVFSFPAHSACLKSVSASPPDAVSSKRWLVTGSTDDNIKVWDLKRRKEVGDLIVHEGATTQIKFIDSKLLLTASTDSSIHLLRTKDWAVLRTLKGHIGRVNDVALHPKGRIALSVGQDRTLRFWDIIGNTGSVTGKGGSSSTKLGQEGDVVRWSTDGSYFAVVCGREVRVYSTNMELLKVLDSKSRFHDIAFFTHPSFPGEELLLLACDDGKCLVYVVSQLIANSSDLVEPISELIGHKNRIKQLAVLPLLKGDESILHCVTASSDGCIHVYDLDVLSTSKEVVPCAKWDTNGSRLTCLTVAGFRTHDVAKPAARQQDADDGSSDGSSEEDSEELSEDDEEANGQEANDMEEPEEEEEEEEEWGGISE